MHAHVRSHVYMHVHMCTCIQGQKRKLDTLELRQQTALSCLTWVQEIPGLCKGGTCTKPLSHLSGPLQGSWCSEICHSPKHYKPSGKPWVMIQCWHHKWPSNRMFPCVGTQQTRAAACTHGAGRGWTCISDNTSLKVQMPRCCVAEDLYTQTQFPHRQSKF